MDYNHLIAKVRTAANGGINVLSSGEALAAALVLNRHDWLTNMGYTIAEAIDRITDEVSPSLLRKAERQIREEMGAAAEAADAQRQVAAMAEIRAMDTSESNAGVDLQARFVTFWESPGYRDVVLVFEVTPEVEAEGTQPTRINIRLQAATTETILLILQKIHCNAWGGPRNRPLDAEPNESRPSWLTRPPMTA